MLVSVLVIGFMYVFTNPVSRQRLTVCLVSLSYRMRSMIVFKVELVPSASHDPETQSTHLVTFLSFFVMPVFLFFKNTTLSCEGEPGNGDGV